MDAEAAVAAWFDAQGTLEVERIGERGWFTVLAGERKRTLPVHVELGEHHLTIQAHFVRAPDEGFAALYDLLLRRHVRSYVLRFALYESGDVMIVGLLPRAAVTTEELDRVLGQLLILADETYDAALRLGFASYIEREQAWRAATGLPRNPVS